MRQINSISRLAIVSAIVLGSCPVYAIEAVNITSPNTEQILEQELKPVNQPEPIQPAPLPVSPEVLNAEQLISSATLQDLKNDPELAASAVNVLVLNQDWDRLRIVLPIYQQFENTDQKLIDYAQGALYREDGEFKKAISLYRNIIAEDPNLLRVRMDLAILLFADRQDIAAKDQFIKLRSDPQLDQATIDAIDGYLDEINQRSAWSFDAGLSYIRDDNVNNASSSKIIEFNGLKFVKRPESLPQSAHGISYSLGASKDFNFSGSNYFSFSFSGNGKTYWDNHDYDDINLRLSSGYKYKDARNNFALTPFVKFRHLGGELYNRAAGVSLSGGRWLTPNWQLSNYNEIAWEKSAIDKDLPSERQYFTNINTVWVPKSTQYFVLGANLLYVDNANKAASYTRPGVNFVWNQDWPYGISSRIDLGLGRKTYKDISIFGVKREDKEYTAGLTLWNRDWHLWGITPKVSFNYNNVDSNIDQMYSYDKGTVFLKFDKTF